ncbi:DUF805 domain-containing protein [Streptomyces sp. NBC_01724]|uniref:DUF805 domain-containing protein n=1 Tax=Streptomyces TaxID=1883 RepID=UPI0028C3E073|nr:MULTISPECIES: DUF805 domain-containing protein [unclassified Streptomyces]WTE53326.1 DUF805 domain-containing protein [Streptomyces sp. NBC_01620]WTE61428.1 DUF805 domain-containing protein [Streptomyces sp. NBC_01617]WTI88843.1 DUF805 domain-containing protein [Streptomyces sp. NBC_00724]WNO66419.1 DUF805 domain-containing protein [Streptomyces sp. AM2-3-1]WSC70953.1 DUF805 domain-containing protein [Streptomyces sp. NBC_01760]
MHWYLDVLKKYAVFSGRARRQEYWMYTLFNVIAVIILAVLDAVLGTQPVLIAIYYLAVLLPSLGVFVRRLHDTGRSGWWILFGIVPLVGGITLLVFSCLEGERSQNAYGPDPKSGYAAA